MKIHFETLTNGMKLAVCEDHFSPVVSIQIWVNVGSADETSGQYGLAHVHEHMLFKGTEKRPVGAIAAAIEGAGGDINAFTSHNHTCYYVTMSSRYFDVGLEVLSDAILNSAFDADELARELEVIKEELSRGNDNPPHKLSEKTFSKAFKAHPYGRPIIGYRKILNSLKRKDVLAFFRRHYRPDNMALVIVGDVDYGTAHKSVLKLFRNFGGKKYRRVTRPAEPIQKSLRTVCLFEKMNEAMCSMVFKSPPLFHYDAPAVDVLAMILGTGESSRLFQRLWEKTGLAYSSYASAFLPKDQGAIITGFGTDPDKFISGLSNMCDEIFSFRANPPTEKELKKVKTLFEAELYYEMETSSGRARKIGYSICNLGKPDLEEKYFRRILKVTARDVQNAAIRYLTPSNMTCGVIAPKEMSGLISGKSLWELVSKGFKPYKNGNRIKSAASKHNPTRPVTVSGIHAKGKRLSKITLSNGLRLIISENPNAQVFAFRAAALGGRIYEPAPGLSKFTSALLGKGTKSLPSTQFAELIDGMAAQVSGFSGLNTLGVNGEFLSRDIVKGADVICDVMLNPAFHEHQMEKMRNELAFGLLRREDNITRKLFDIFNKALFKKHPYSLPDLGTIDSIKSIGSNQINRFWKRALNPGNLVVSISGDVKTAAIVKMFEERLGGLKSGLPFKTPPIVNPPQKPLWTQHHMPKEQAHLILGFLGIANDHPDRYALEVMMAVMSGQGGRLFINLRDKMNLAYAISGFHTEGIGTGSLGFYIGTGQQNVDIAIEAMKDQVRRLVNDGITKDELDRAKRYLVGSFDIELASNSSMATQTALSELYGIGYRSHKKYASNISKISMKKVRDCARNLLDLDRCVLALITD